MALTDILTAIGDAIREKMGTTDLIPLADMPDVIASISGGASGKQQKTGTFTLDANANQPEITHDCGFVPSVFMVYPIDEYTIGNRMAIGCMIVNIPQINDLTPDKLPHMAWECQDSGTNWQQCSTSYQGELTKTTAKLCVRTPTYQWKADFQYGWIAIE